jgi:ABC-type bacteriocin/lantibiotic exporter with double-glycine peptidase domain
MLNEVAHDAAIHEEIIIRPGGYDYPLIEGGRNLSGGQRQRLEIARALLFHPTFLILDEATSALDSKTEKQILNRLKRRGCSIMMIAHRLSTVQDCDEILVMDQGQIVQIGTHEELKQIPGIYQKLANSELSHG